MRSREGLLPGLCCRGWCRAWCMPSKGEQRAPEEEGIVSMLHGGMLQVLLFHSHRLITSKSLGLMSHACKLILL